MAVKLAKKNNVYNMQVRTFYIDSVDDLAVIETQYDCGIGDRAELPDGTVYCRHSDGYTGDLWAVRSSGSKPSPSPSPSPSGSDLPAVTEDDIGKYLRVQGVMDGMSTVIVPEQTVTVSQEQPVALLEDADASLFVIGTEVLIHINDNEYVGRIAALDEGVVGWMDSSVGAIVYMEGQSGSGVIFNGSDAGEYTVSMGTVNYEPSWVKTDPDYKVTTDNITLIPPTEISATTEWSGMYMCLVEDFDSISGALIDYGTLATVVISDGTLDDTLLMPIHTYTNTDSDAYIDWAIGDYSPASGPQFDNFPIALVYNQYTKELCVYAMEAAPDIIIQASYTQNVADMSDGFIIASQAADNTVIICPKQTVTLADDAVTDVKLTYAPDVFSTDTGFFTNHSRMFPRTTVTVNGIELPYDVDDGVWQTTVSGTEYIVYLNDSDAHLYLSCWDVEADTTRPGDYEVSVQTTKYTEPNPPEYLIVRMTWSKSDVGCNYSYDELVNALNNNIPLIAYINNRPCTSTPLNISGIYDGDVLSFQIMEREPIVGSNNALLVVKEFSISNDNGSDAYNYQEWKYTLTAAPSPDV